MADSQSSQKPETNGLLARVATEPGHPKETIEEASRSVNRDFPKGSLNLSHAELRKNFKVRVSGDLAAGLWYLLGFVVVVHLLAVTALAWRLSNQPTAGDSEEKRIERIEKAVSTVTDTAKTLYPVLGVLTAAVTGYYFSSGADSAPSDEDEKET
ncbi:hypothetical protein H6F89_31045 [Cyanobacteria bacterium FACHB-63]|nr:hypothetical protein [Cyanobacteria bacterium FACHB-63]